MECRDRRSGPGRVAEGMEWARVAATVTDDNDVAADAGNATTDAGLKAVLVKFVATLSL